MPRPETKIEVAFNVGVTGTPVWTDVTQRVKNDPGIEIEHWRDEEDSETQESRCTLVLMNNDGRFTPGNTSSVYYPNVKRNRPLRVTSTHNGVTYTRFRGYIDDWRVEWPAVVSGHSVVTVSATSRMARLGRGAELLSVIEQEVLLDAPDYYYTFGEAEGSLQASDSSGNNGPALTIKDWDPLDAGANPAFGSAEGPTTDGLTGVTMPAAGGKYLGGVITPTSGSSLTIEAFITTTNNGPQDIVNVTNATTFDDCIALLSGITSGILYGRVRLGATIIDLEAGSIDDGDVHHVALRATDVGANVELDMFLDGILVNSGSAAMNLPSVSIVNVGTGIVGGTPFEGSLFHFAIHDSNTELTDARIEAHAEAGLTGFAGETTAARAARYAGYAGLAPADYSFAGDTYMAHLDIRGLTALDALRQVEITEGGVLYDSLDGILTMDSRDARYGVASAFTVSYLAGEVNGALLPVVDDQHQVNHMTAVNADDVLAVVKDQTSIGDDGYYRDEVVLVTQDQHEPLSRASWVVENYAVPVPRIADVQLLLNNADNALVAGALSADPGTKFTVAGLPANAPASSMVLFVEGRHEFITMEEDRITLHTSPAELWDAFILGSATDGVLDSDRLGY